MADPIRDEKVLTLESSLRYYVALCRRLERRAEAAELEVESLRQRMAVAGITLYNVLDD